MEYPEAFKARMVQKLTAPGAPSATALSEEVGVAQPTLSKWVREAGRVGGMARTKLPKAGARKRPQDWTAEEKLEAVIEATSLSEEDLGIFLRRGFSGGSYAARSPPGNPPAVSTWPEVRRGSSGGFSRRIARAPSIRPRESSAPDRSPPP